MMPVKDIKQGEIISAKYLRSITRQLNANTRAIAAPKQKDIELGDDALTPGEAVQIGNEIFSAAATDITDETVQITDSNGDTHDIERITQIVLTETSTGRTMTLNIAYT